MRRERKVLEDDQAAVKSLTQAFADLLHACREVDGYSDDVSGSVALRSRNNIVVFTGAASNGAEIVGKHVVLKVHLFPSDSDETLWHNHGQSFFGSLKQNFTKIDSNKLLRIRHNYIRKFMYIEN